MRYSIQHVSINARLFIISIYVIGKNKGILSIESFTQLTLVRNIVNSKFMFGIFTLSTLIDRNVKRRVFIIQKSTYFGGKTEAKKKQRSNVYIWLHRL